MKEYFRYREDLSVCDGLILFKSRVLVPRSLRREVLECLHSVHQGVQGMKSRAAESVFWPGISAAIHDVRARCRTCNTIAPSQPAEPPITADPHSSHMSKCVRISLSSVAFSTLPWLTATLDGCQ